MKHSAGGKSIIRVENITKTFAAAEGRDGKLFVLRGITMSVAEGEIVAVVGASGAGKSTLLHIIGTLDRPSAGQVYYDDSDVFRMMDEDLARFRNKRVGFVFQFHHLLPEFTALENVMMPALIKGAKVSECREHAIGLLEQVGIGEKANSRPAQLAGGEQQRIAVARALMNNPAVVLADEPTGNLDTTNAAALHDLMRNLSRERQQTFIVVTHNESLARMADRVLRIRDGVVHAE